MDVVRHNRVHLRKTNETVVVGLACVAAVSFPFLFQAESEQASEKSGGGYGEQEIGVKWGGG